MDEHAVDDPNTTEVEAARWRLRYARPRSELSEAEKRWQEENKAAIDSMNAWVEEHGLPLEKYRRR